MSDKTCINNYEADNIGHTKTTNTFNIGDKYGFRIVKTIVK